MPYPPPPPPPPPYPPDSRSPRPSLPQIPTFNWNFPPDAAHNSPAFESNLGQLSRRLRDDRFRRNALRDAQASIRQRIRRIQGLRHVSGPSSSTPQPDMEREGAFSPPSQALLDELEEANRALQQSQRTTSTILGRLEAANSSFSLPRHPNEANPAAAGPTPASISVSRSRISQPNPPSTSDTIRFTLRQYQAQQAQFQLNRDQAELEHNRARLHRASQQPLELAGEAGLEREHVPSANVAMADVGARITAVSLQRRLPENYPRHHQPNVGVFTGLSPRRRRRLSVSSLRPANSNIRTSTTHEARDNQQRSLNRRRRLFSSEEHDRDHILWPRRSERAVYSDMATDSDTDSNNLQGRRLPPKRRKLIHDCEFDDYNPIKYGWNGQVDPGLLRLEIVSCDGGEFSRHPSVYRAENVLQDDTSVYCSKASKCTLLFRHQLETSFSVERIFIRGPDTGYTSPVQQGIVFVGMCADKLLYSAAAYKMTYADFDQRNPTLCYGNSGERIDSSTEYPHSNTQGQASNPFLSDEFDLGPLDFECEWPGDVTSTQAQLTTAPSPPYDFGDSESSSDTEAALEMRQGLRRTVYRHGNHRVVIGALPVSNRRGDVVDDNDYREPNRNLDEPYVQRCICASYKSRIEKVVPPGCKSDEILTPNAQFRIHKWQKNINIQFNAPIAGRYILLKLFNPNRDTENIDVQYVAVHGYSGARYIPGIEFR